MKRHIIWALAIFLVFASCKGKQKGIEATTPDPLENVAVAMDGGSSIGKYLLVTDVDGKGTLKRVADGEEASVVVTVDANNQFDFTAVFSDKTTIRVKGTYINGEFKDVVFIDGNNEFAASISDIEEDVKEQNNAPDDETTEAPKWLMVSAFGDHTCAIKSDKTVWCWGDNSNGQCGVAGKSSLTVPTQVAGVSDAAFIKSGMTRTCIINTSNDVWCWGGGNTAPTKVDSLKNVKSLSFVIDDAYVIMQDKSVQFSLATTSYATTDLPFSQLKQIEATVAGYYFLKDDSNLKYSTGEGMASTQILDSVSSFTVYVGPESAGVSYAVKNDGSVWYWDAAAKSPTALQGFTSAKLIARGGTDRCIINSDNTLWCAAISNSPKQIDIVPVKLVAMGLSHTCAIDTSDYLWCWGENASGQIGNGTFDSQSVPTNGMIQ